MTKLSSIFVCTLFTCSVLPIFDAQKAILKECTEQYGTQAVRGTTLQSFAQYFSQRSTSLRKDTLEQEVDQWLQIQAQLCRRRQIGSSQIMQSLFEERSLMSKVKTITLKTLL